MSTLIVEVNKWNKSLTSLKVFWQLCLLCTFLYRNDNCIAKKISHKLAAQSLVQEACELIWHSMNKPAFDHESMARLIVVSFQIQFWKYYRSRMYAIQAVFARWYSIESIQWPSVNITRMILFASILRCKSLIDVSNVLIG